MEKRTEPEATLDFRPITDGLGFHPFSDGLPYAPVAKTAPMGTGAEAAGPARFAYPAPSPAAPVSVPAEKIRQALQKPAGRVSVPVATPAAAAAPALAAPKAQPARPEARFESRYGMVYLLKRVLAYLIDSAFNAALCVGALSAALWNQNLRPELLLNPGVAFVAVLFVAVFSWALVTAEEIAFGTSVGKRIFGLALQGSASAVFIRAFFFVPSVAFCGLGLVWSLFDKRRRCWHDVAADLQPMEIARL